MALPEQSLRGGALFEAGLRREFVGRMGDLALISHLASTNEKGLSDSSRAVGNWLRVV
jgi:hypothetical protein